MGGMALIDYIDTKNRIIKYLGHGAKTPDEVRNMMIRPTEDEADLDSLLEEMKEANLIHNHFGRLHLITPQSEERRKNKRDRKAFRSSSVSFLLPSVFFKSPSS